MDLKTAYSILELSPSASKDEAKKKYRELTKKFHPDVNKDPGAEDKFKKINEAYQVVSAGKQKVKKSNPIYGNPFFSHEQMVEPIEIEITISFKESVLGCKKDISYERTIKCGSCGGAGETSENNGCDQCGGRGVSIKRTGNSIMTQTCNKCHGVTNKKPCVICDESGGAITTTSVSVTIPAGIPNASMMRLGGMGHYAGSIMMMDQYQDAFLKVNVESEEGLEVDGADVVSNVSINLIDALTGCERKVKTINGDKDIVINPRSLNKDEVIIKNMGVAGKGNQRVIINVSYPEDVSKIIDVLKE